VQAGAPLRKDRRAIGCGDVKDVVAEEWWQHLQPRPSPLLGGFKE
jgi:hypothetical protein